MSIRISKGVKTGLKQLRQAAGNLSIEASDGAISEEARDMLRSAASLCCRLANAIELGSEHEVVGWANDFQVYNNKVKR